MFKKFIFLAIFSIFIFSLSACGAASKEFTGSGIVITLTEDFVQKEVIQAPFYLESQDHIFMGMRESKTDLNAYAISTLEGYINAVLAAGGEKTSTFSYEEDDVHYMYAYYTRTVSEVDYGYMLLVMEGANHFYTMNFGCLENHLDDNKDLYSDWANSITVE